MGDDDTNQKKQKPKWTTSYSDMSLLDAENRLGFRMNTIRVVPVHNMLTEANYTLEGEDSISKTKEKVCDRIVQYLIIEGYPTEANSYFINNLIFCTISPILYHFILKTGRNSLQLLRDKEIVSTDSVTGGYGEFVVMDLISVEESNYVLIVEAKRSSLEEAVKQCLLSMKDMRDNNDGGEVYGFVTTGKSWQMLKYDGALFQMTRKIDVLFNGMEQEKELWMKDCSALVDCMNIALSNGGIMKKDVVAFR